VVSMKKNKMNYFKKENSGLSINKLERLAAAFRNAMSNGDFLQARKNCEAVLRFTPGNPSVIGDYALTLMRTGEYQKAYDIYHSMFVQKEKIHFQGNWIDGLAEVCGWLDKKEELQHYGHYALEMADRQYRLGAVYAFPSSQPPAFAPVQKNKNVVSFSLYGTAPRYCETLIRNIELSSDFYPDWACRVYHDNTVPVSVLSKLHELGAQLVDMSHEKIIPPTLWRFLVIDDPDVTRYLIRDADSLFSEKEVAAVQEWLQSSCWFHHMRDYFTHTELMLAGMWGGCRGIFPSVKQLIEEFVANDKGPERYTDQHFLRAALWPTVRTSILNHDEIFLFHNARKYPSHLPDRWPQNNFHIGSNASYSSMNGELKHSGKNEVQIEVESAGFVRRYTAKVRNDKWRLQVPFFLIDEFQQAKLKVSMLDD